MLPRVSCWKYPFLIALIRADFAALKPMRRRHSVSVVRNSSYKIKWSIYWPTTTTIFWAEADSFRKHLDFLYQYACHKPESLLWGERRHYRLPYKSSASNWCVGNRSEERRVGKEGGRKG